MTLTLYDLAGADDACRFSPHCWRSRMALAHKRLEAEALPWRFTEKEAIAPSGQGATPVLRDGERWIADSWAIAEHLEEAYPDRPALFEGEADQAKSLFLNGWTMRTLHPLVFRAIARELFEILAEKDKGYFRESREKRFGRTLEEVGAEPDAAIGELDRAVQPLRDTLGRYDFLGGGRPGYGDYIVFGAFQWARVASRRPLVAENDPIARWFARLLEAFDGLGARTPARADTPIR